MVIAPSTGTFNPFQERLEGSGFGTPGGFAHIAQNSAVVCHNSGVAYIEGIQGGLAIGREIIDLDAKLPQALHKRLILGYSLVEGGGGGIAQPLPFAVDLGLVGKGIAGVVEQEVPERRNHRGASEVGHRAKGAQR